MNKSMNKSKLWLQYLDKVYILQSFIKAGRTGDWMMHLVVLRKMLPYLAVAGHKPLHKITTPLFAEDGSSGGTTSQCI